MFKKRSLLVLATAFLLAGCGKPADDGMDYGQNENPEVSPFAMYMVGSHWTWEPSEAAGEKANLCKFTKVTGSAKLVYEFDVTAPMVAEWFGFKFVAAGSWNEQFGVEDIDMEACNAGFKTLMGYTTQDAFRETYNSPPNNRSNIAPSTHVLGAHFKITYDPLDFRADDDYTYHFVVDYTLPTA